MLKKERREFLLQLFVISIAFLLFFALCNEFIGLVTYDNSEITITSRNDTMTEYKVPYEVFIDNLEFIPNDLQVIYTDKNDNGMIDHFYVNNDVNFKIKINFNEEEIVNITTKDKENINIQTIEQGELNNIIKNVEKVSLDQELKINLQDSIPLLNINDTHYNNITGNNKNICVIDTGISNHPDLINRVINQKCYCYNCCPNGLSEDENASDDIGHGTLVSGIAGAYGNITGTAVGAKFIEIKACDSSGYCKSSDIIKAINYCLTNKNTLNISIITLSLGSLTQYNDLETCNNANSILTEAINRAYENNIFVSISSGNDYNKNGISYPACLENVTSVGATTKSDAIASYSNIGSLLDVLAPGSSINSTTCTGSGKLCNPSGYTNAYSGTSFAAPFVAGSASLILSYNNISPKDIKNLLKNTGKKITYNGQNYSRINVLAAIQNISINDSTNENISNITYPKIWHDLNKSLPFGNSIKKYNEVIFYANLTNLTINSTNCTIKIENITYNMSFNQEKQVMEYHKNITEFEDIEYIIYCENETYNSTLKKDEMNFYNNKTLTINIKNNNATTNDLSLRIFEFNNTNYIYNMMSEENIILNLTKFLIIKGEEINKTPYSLIINYSDFIFVKNITLENDTLEEFNFNVTIQETVVPVSSPSSGGSSGGGGGGSSTKKTKIVTEPQEEDTSEPEEEFLIHDGEPTDITRVLENKQEIDNTKSYYILIISIVIGIFFVAYLIYVNLTTKKKFIKNNTKRKNKKR